ncbi:tail fiber domain-containing protein [Winogradskyella sp. PC D3.3]
MKPRITLLFTVLFSTICLAQNGINYKAIIKDSSGNVISNDLISVQFTILQGVDQTNVYQETHTPTTDVNGLIIVNIGEGTPISGTFATIDWASDTTFLNTKINIGAGLVDMGTTEFKTVPYALNALKSNDNYWNKNGTVVNNTSDNVGIGSDVLSAKLGVLHNSSMGNPHILVQEAGQDYARINLGNINNETNWSIQGYIGDTDSGINDRLNFWNDRMGDIMSITGDGEVGIGVGISPKVNLHVGNEKRVLFGADTLGSGDKLMWLPDLHAFRVGALANGASSVYWNNEVYYDDFHEREINYIGLYSFASGYNTRAQGYCATAMGRHTEATSNYAFATGYYTHADGKYSTAMGYNTNASGEGSTALGYSTDAIGSYSTALGQFVTAKAYSSTAVGRYNLGGGNAESWVETDPVFEIGIGSSSVSRANAMTVKKNGNVGIGVSNPQARLHIDNGNLRIGSAEEFEDGGSYLILVNSTIAPEVNGIATLGNSSYRWSSVYAINGTINTSDRRDKKSIEDIGYGLKEVMQLRPVSYQWKNKNFSQGKPKLGLIAQDVKDIISEVVIDKEWVTDEKTGEQKEKAAERLGIYYSDLIPVLIKAIQEQQEIIKQQDLKINGLTAELTQLKTLDTRVEQLEAMLKTLDQ